MELSAEERTMSAGAALQRLVRETTDGRANLVHWELTHTMLRLVLQRKEDFTGHQIEVIAKRPAATESESLQQERENLWQNLKQEIRKVVPAEEEIEAAPI